MIHLSLFILMAAVAAAQDPGAIQRFETSSRLASLMVRHRVPAVSIAVLRAGKIAWAKAYGSANTDTIFQAASISKPVAAMAALHMSQYGHFTLDDDVNTRLKSWQVPASSKLTLRGILSHSAGLTVHGFPGYRSDAPIPTLLQILQGEPPANTPPIRQQVEPGTKWRYSGGGYVVLQQLLIDRMGWTFPEIMQRMVLGRIGMKRSTFQQPLPEPMAVNAALAHDSQGQPVPGRWHSYPEMAAAGLWTTPTDLALWAIELRAAYHGRSNRILERATAREMLTRQNDRWGLGPQLAGEGASFHFLHGGSNEGYRCLLLMLVESGDGAVIMTNSANGGRIFQPVVRALAAEYGWPAGVDWSASASGPRLGPWVAIAAPDPPWPEPHTRSLR